MIGLGLSIVRGGGAWSPAALFGPSDNGLLWDFGDKSRLFQSSTAATTPVTADGDVVGYVLDKSGKGNHGNTVTDARRGLWRAAQNGYVEFDGVDDRLLNIGGVLQSVTQTMAWCGVLRTGYSNGGRIIGRSTNRSLQWLTAPQMRYTSNETPAAVNITGATNPLLPTVVIARQVSNAVANVNYNGVQLGDFDPADDTSNDFAMGLPAASSFQPQNCNAVLLINRALTDSEMTMLKGWMAAKAGATVS